MNACTNRIGFEDGEDEGPCGDEGRVCAACHTAEAKLWARHFGQDYGTREERRARLAAMDPRSESAKVGGL